MMRTIVFFFLLCATCVATTLAERLEPYYVKVAYTWPITTYSQKFEQYVQGVTIRGGYHSPIAIGEKSRIPLSGEVGIYWPATALERHVLIGVNCTGFRETYTYDKWKQESAVFFGLFSGTAQYYLTGSIGSGLFMRLDVGFAMENIYERVDKLEYFGETYLGFGILGGVGYAIPVLTGTHLTVETWYAMRDVGKYSASTWHIGVGVMW